MKKTITIFLFISFVSTLIAQEYFTVDFTANTQLDSIYIENTNQNESITINGDDILHLILETSFVNETMIDENQIIVFPNPSEQISYIQFRNSHSVNALFQIIDISGKTVYNKEKFIKKGKHCFYLTGLSSGTYILSLQIGDKHLEEKILVSGNPNSTLTFEETEPYNNNELIITSKNKDASDIIDLPFNIGDQLQITGYANGYNEAIIYSSPTEDVTIELLLELTEFVCGETFIDSRDNNAYTTVQIGEQCWFAENIRYLPSVNYIVSNTEPVYFVFSYYGTNLNEATELILYERYGALYNHLAAISACPDGWHLSSDEEWKTLEMHLGMSITEANEMNSRGTNEGSKLSNNEELWHDGSLEYDADFGSSGFNAIPGGMFFQSDGMFFEAASGSHFWTSTLSEEYPDTSLFFSRATYYDNTQISRYTWTNASGFSVRCVKD